ncbi:MAG: 1-deoxy-D-xylulose-5-phosphate synthase [Bacteroidales bacterium]
MSYPLLDTINTPDDLKQLKEEQLPEVCQDLRQYIIDVVSSNPGHFGASLGVVELTVALHYIFNTPYDRIVWDVGHQAYGHKILTGRKDRFHTNRRYKGISGFPKIDESPYDAFGVGHSSTSISAALGMAKAAKFKGEDRQVIAVIGDGSLTAGLAFEGMNNAGTEKTDLLVVLNDNRMAIDPNVGALKEYLLDITTSQTYNKFKDDVWHALGRLNKLGLRYQRITQQIENAIKSAVLKQSNLFESLNFRYFGPIDGHDVMHLTKVMEDLKHIKGPKLLHVLTQKGKGFPQAEQNQTAFHAPGIFDKVTGEIFKIKSETKQPPKYQEVFGYTLLELARKNERIVGVTPAMPTGSSMNIMMKALPERTFDVGIAEQHAVTFSAGLAREGMKPFCNIYSTFMQRAYDQVLHDVALQHLPVVFCLDRGGLVGEDGATHHGAYDLAYMRSIPEMVIAAPMNEEELRNMMFTAEHYHKGPFTIRYPRGRGVLSEWETAFSKQVVGKGRCLKSGSDIAVLSVGHPGNFVAEAIQQMQKEPVDIAHYDLRYVKPLDTELLDEVAAHFTKVITVEDGTIVGGFGSAVLEYFSDINAHVQVKRMGIPDSYVEQGTPAELYQECGFDAQGIEQAIREMIGIKRLSNVG